jgi:GAF domain-containing protein
LPAKLTICYPDRPAIESILMENGRYRVGRSAQCDLVVLHPSVSRHHALVTHNCGHWLVKDVQSHNGTRVNGQRIANSQLLGNELISVGAIDCFFELQDRQQVEGALRHNAWRRRQSTLSQSALTKCSLQQGLDDSLVSLISLTGTQRGLILLGSGPGDLRVLASKGMATADFTRSGFEGSVGAIVRVADTHQPVIIMDVSLDSGFSARESIQRKQISTLVCVPLLSQERLIGIAYIDSQLTNKIFSEMDYEIMRLVCGQIELNTQALLLHEEIDRLLLTLPYPKFIGDMIERPAVNLCN